MVLAAAVAVAPSLAQGAPPKVDAKLRGTRAPATELKQSKVIAVPGGGTLYRFRQQVSGVPVLGGEAVVSDPAAAPPGLVVDVTKARIQKPPAIGLCAAAPGRNRRPRSAPTNARRSRRIR